MYGIEIFNIYKVPYTAVNYLSGDRIFQCLTDAGSVGKNIEMAMKEQDRKCRGGCLVQALLDPGYL